MSAPTPLPALIRIVASALRHDPDSERRRTVHLARECAAQADTLERQEEMNPSTPTRRPE